MISSDDGASVGSEKVVIDLAADDSDDGDNFVPPMIQIGVPSAPRGGRSRRRPANQQHSGRRNHHQRTNSSRSSATTSGSNSTTERNEVARRRDATTSTSTSSHAVRPQPSPPPPVRTTPNFPLLYMKDPNENVEVAEQLLGLINIFELPRARTCCRPDERNSSDVHHLPLLHIHQRDQWSCGFRNLQMLLCGILLMVPPGHPYFTQEGTGASTNEQQHAQVRTIPSLLTLQQWLEKAWSEGFDERGRRDYGGAIASHDRWIGAVEAVSILWYKNIDAVVIQFISCSASRKMLAPFVWNYFCSRNCGCGNCSTMTDDDDDDEVGLVQGPRSCTDYARYLLVLATTGEEPQTPRCQCPTPPLYLQWKGHSVTIVGIQKLAGEDEYDLILFDPARSGAMLEQSLTSSLEGRIGLAKAFQHIKKSSRDLLQRDCQIILSTDRKGLTRDERDSFKRTYVVTAAEGKVRERMGSSGHRSGRSGDGGGWQQVPAVIR